MANPAELLHKQLSGWADSTTKTAKEARRLVRQNGENISKFRSRTAQIWADHRLAVTRLNQVVESIEIAKREGVPVTVYEQFIPQWTEAIFAFPHGWSERDQPGILKVPLDQLESVAALLNFVIPKFEEGSSEKFSNFLEVLLHRVSTLDETHRFLREHSIRIIQHLRGCLEDLDLYGEFKIIDALHELKYILEALEEAADTPEDKKFYQKAREGAWGFFKKSTGAVVLTGSILASSSLEQAGEDLYELVKEELPAISSSNEEPTEAKDSYDETSESDSEG